MSPHDRRKQAVSDIKTERGLSERGVLLRPWTLADAAAVAEALADPEVHRWTPLPNASSIQEAVAWIETRIAQAATDQHEHFALATGNGLAGGVNVYFHDPRRAELGYFIAPAARRRGIASEGVRLTVKWAHGNGVERLEALIDHENTASAPVVEQAGFRREGLLRSYRVLRGVPRDMYIYARLAADGCPPTAKRSLMG